MTDPEGMDFETFEKSIQPGQHPPHCNQYALALWYERMGNWQEAHAIIQDIDDRNAAWIHAYLHRREGDQGNAGYWYRLAGKSFPAISLDEEWNVIARSVL